MKIFKKIIALQDKISKSNDWGVNN